jgi:branched-chain amino acid transport system substrate-binding protein
VSAVVVLGVALASCGTRLPPKAFGGDPTLGRGATTVATTPALSGNPASDTGVTPTEVRVGLIVSETSPLGAEVFSGPMYGALAYFQGLVRRGGVDGRSVRVIVCDDGATGSGNRACARKLIEDDKVFAFAGNSIFNYAAASYVSSKDVPDVGGEPIGNEYDQYQHLYSIYGSNYPRNGTVGYNGKLQTGTEVYRYFKVNLGSHVAGVVYYNQSDSQRFGDLTASSLRLEGYDVVREQVDFAVPNFDAAVIDMKAHHVDTVFDALDTTGNVGLCKAMDAARFTVKAKVTTVQNWTDAVRTDYASTPTCRNALYATAQDRNYMDTQFTAVAGFRADMKAAYPEREGRLSMWEQEGWASAQWLTDAMTSCGVALTRRCIEAYLNRPGPYTGHGLLTGASFVVTPPDVGDSPHCMNVARWQDSAYGGRGGWVTTTPGDDFTCYDVPSVSYSP